MSIATVGRRGRSLAVCLPAEFAAALHPLEGERIEMDTEADQIVIGRAPRYTVEAMFAGKPADEWRTLSADAFDRGRTLAGKSLKTDVRCLAARRGRSDLDRLRAGQGT